MSELRMMTGDDLPKSFLPFSPAVQAGDFLFNSGQASVDMQGNIVTGTFEEECRRTFENLKLILTGAGLGFRDVVQVRNYVGKQEYLSEFNRIYKDYFQEPYPARVTISGCLGDYLKFEAEAIAFIKR